MKYSIVIPTHNHCDDLLKPCVESVLAHTHMDQVQLIICANGCTDNTSYYLQRLKNQFDRLGFADHFQVITTQHALGFAAACNQGLRVATGDRVVILHNDCVLQAQNTHTWLHILNAPFDQDAATGITCTLELPLHVHTQSYVPFFCVMMDRKVIQQVGMLNDTLQMPHAVDTEYCHRVQQAGFKIVNVDTTEYLPDAHVHVGKFPVYHKGGGSVQAVSFMPDVNPVFEQNTLPPQAFTPCVTAAQVAAKYAWLANVNTEAPELFKEVIATNTYKLEPAHVINRSVIDVGANLGMFSIMCAALGAPQVWACEPVSSTHDMLMQHTQRAQLQDRIHTVRAAITGAVQGPVMMGMHADSGKNSLYDVGTHAEMVPTRTLAQLVSECTQDQILLKMDCEGAEYDILLDSHASTFDRIHTIMMETHGDMHPTHKGLPVLHDRLTQLGFKQLDYQPYGIWWYDASGTPVRWEPLNMSIELWNK